MPTAVIEDETNTALTSLLIDPVAAAGGVAPDNHSAALELNTTSGALLISRMTTAQRDALTVVNGMMVYTTDLVPTPAFQVYQNNAWVTLGAGGGGAITGGGTANNLAVFTGATAIGDSGTPIAVGNVVTAPTAVTALEVPAFTGTDKQVRNTQITITNGSSNFGDIIGGVQGVVGYDGGSLNNNAVYIKVIPGAGGASIQLARFTQAVQDDPTKGGLAITSSNHQVRTSFALLDIQEGKAIILPDAGGLNTITTQIVGMVAFDATTATLNYCHTAGTGGHPENFSTVATTTTAVQNVANISTIPTTTGTLYYDVATTSLKYCTAGGAAGAGTFRTIATT